MHKKILSCLFIFLVASKLYSYEFAIGSMFKNEAPYLKEWIEYHLMLGAEHFWLYNNESSDDWEVILDPYIEKGLVEVIDWPCSISPIDKSNPWPFELQAEAIKDAFRRAKGKTRWFSFIDVDEFFLPKDSLTIIECLNKHFSDASAVFVSWRSFGTNNLTIPLGSPFLCKLTARAVKDHFKNTNGKSIWRPEEVDIDRIFWVHTAPLLTQGKYLNGSGLPCIADPKEARWHWDVNEDFIRLNHYFFRDEFFFKKRRLSLAEKGIGVYSVSQLLDFHQEFSKEQDCSMRTFIRENHPEMFNQFWSKLKPAINRVYHQKNADNLTSE